MALVAITATMDDIRREVKEIRQVRPNLSRDNAFVAWFMRAYLTEDQGMASVLGASRDKGIDGLYIDTEAEAVFVVQGKYRTTDRPPAEKRADVIAFADVGVAMLEGGAVLDAMCNTADPAVATRVREAVARFKRSDYALRMHYVTTGSVTPALEDEARLRLEPWGAASIECHGRRDVLNLYRDYVEGVAPPVGTVELQIEGGEVLGRYDQATGIQSWVFSMRSPDVKQHLGSVGPRIFARNIRGFLGSTEVNRGIQSTLQTDPEDFWYLNNGITIICDAAEKKDSLGSQRLHVRHPQIINGQQTTRVLTENSARAASVLVKVIAIPHDSSEKHAKFGRLTARIVSATNWQNQIKASDLRANDSEQVRIEREVRKLGYQYLRKRQSKGEARRAAGGRYSFQVTKEELATAIAGSLMDPAVLRRGKEALFEDETYPQLFSPDRGIHEYLVFYWLQVAARAQARGNPRKGYARWLVLNFLWGASEPLRSRTKAKRFIYAMERRKVHDRETALVVDSITGAMDILYGAALAFYRSHPEGGKGQLDESSFFRHTNLHREFRQFWSTYSQTKVAQFDKRLERLQTELQNLDAM